MAPASTRVIAAVAASGPVQPERDPGQRRHRLHASRSPRRRRATCSAGCAIRASGSSPPGSTPSALYTDVDLTGPIALVLGAEAEGLGGAWADADVEAIRLPMHGVADSLNVSVSAAILFYEARRQRDLAGTSTRG